MQWEGREESVNVEDRRGSGRRVGLAVGGGGSLLLRITGRSVFISWTEATSNRR